MEKNEKRYAKLIRHHTMVQGAVNCNYWYIGDQETNGERTFR